MSVEPPEVNQGFWATVTSAPSWVVFFLGGLAVLFVGAFGRFLYGDYAVQNAYYQPPLFVLGSLLILASLVLVARQQIWPKQTTLTAPALPSFSVDPKQYDVQFTEPEKDGARIGTPWVMSGTIAADLPEDVELWIFGIGGPAGAVEYWPHRRIDILADRKWTYKYQPENFTEDDTRTLQLYFVGPEGRKLIRCTRYINEEHIKVWNKTLKERPDIKDIKPPGHFAVLHLTDDFIKACRPLRVKLSHEVKQRL